MLSYSFFVLLSKLIVLCIPFAMVRAETVEVPSARNSLRSGSWSLQFEVAENFKVKDFNGFLFSLKKHTSAGKAFRLGLGVSGSISDVNLSSTFQQDSFFQQTSQDADLDAQSIDFVLQYLSYPSPDAEVNLFLGGGPVVRYSHSGSQSSYRGSTRESDQIIWVAGASGLLGAEWFATKSISFLAEYNLSLEYQLKKRANTFRIPSNNYSARNEQSENSLRINPTSLKVGLSVYF